MAFMVTGFFLFTSMDALYDAHPPQSGVMVVDVTHTDPKAAAKTAPAVVGPTPKVETVPEEKPATTPGVGSPFQGQPCESGDANSGGPCTTSQQCPRDQVATALRVYPRV